MLLLLATVLAASESQRHYHNGRLSRYEIGPPSVQLSASDESRLRSGRAVLQSVESEDGLSRRLIMVQDVQAPVQVVLGRIMDLDKYVDMVSGVDSSATYEDTTTKNGQHIVKAVYEISALHMKFKYYVTHTFDPVKNCMVFHLDYDRRSDLDDTVGYWFADPLGRASCRVYYSCECKLRGWVPAPVYNMLTKEAVKKATTWVERESLKEYRAARSGFIRPGALVQAATRMRDELAEQASQLKLPALPQLPQQLRPQQLHLPPLPSLASLRQATEQRFADRRQAAVRLVPTAFKS